ncbi:MAG: hypothetical protein MUF18_07320 [Fimbriiglobus sp.]|jgi:hypothetical protein|nr:hypothetical protein [Fimbriiglobus sp.]
MKKLQPLLLALVPLMLLGCEGGEKRTPTFEVRGKLTDGVKPLADVQVVFHPVNAGPDTPKPRGKTNTSGEFKLTTYDANDGAPAGQYKVSVELWKTVNADSGPVNQLPAKFADPEKSGLTATVNAGPTELQPFVLKK